MSEDISFFKDYKDGQLDVECQISEYRCIGEIENITIDDSEVKIEFVRRAILKNEKWQNTDELEYTFNLNDFHQSKLSTSGEEYIVLTGLEDFTHLTFISEKSRKKFDRRIIGRPN